MESNKVIIEFQMLRQELKTVDLELPLDITANDMILALNEIYNLGINVADMSSCYMKAENPIMLLKGNKTLKEYGVRNGTKLIFCDGQWCNKE